MWLVGGEFDGGSADCTMNAPPQLPIICTAVRVGTYWYRHKWVFFRDNARVRGCEAALSMTNICGSSKCPYLNLLRDQKLPSVMALQSRGQLPQLPQHPSEGRPLVGVVKSMCSLAVALKYSNNNRARRRPTARTTGGPDRFTRTSVDIPAPRCWLGGSPPPCAWGGGPERAW